MNVMLDLETMGTKPGCAIVAIGAVAFDKNGIIYRDDGKLVRFYERINLQSCLDAGLHIDADTVMWWMGQSDDARNEICGPSLPLPMVMETFRNWVNLECGYDAKMWGNGSDFDNVILTAAYDAIGNERPWGRKNDRCYRTVRSLFPDVEYVFNGTKHNALHDAESQALHLIKLIPDRL